MTLYIASSNPGKLRDFALAAPGPVTILPLPGLADLPAPPEDEPTFAGNARAKAVAYSLLAPGLTVLADDSGLELDALHGEPGVHSARYADDHNFLLQASPGERNLQCLLLRAAHLAGNAREARYRCVLAAARNGQVLTIAEGAVEGILTQAKQGIGGFGYDPIFFLPELNRTMAELSPETRLSLSHRGRAITALINKIAQCER